MNVFVTVGTTRFDSLINHVVQDPFFSDCDCILQVGNKVLCPKGFDCFEYTDSIHHYYHWADVVVTHGGGGSVYQLLALSKPIVIVPNYDRLDKHQCDIARFMHENGHALVVESLDMLSETVKKAANMTFRPFKRDKFFVTEDILGFLLGDN